MDELAFGGAANGRITGLPGDAIKIEAEQGGVQAQPGGGDRCFTTGMAAANHDHVEGFGGGGAEAHGFIIGTREFLRLVGSASTVSKTLSVSNQSPGQCPREWSR